MKKLSVILLALAIAAFAVPAIAGEVSMDGEYGLGGYAESNGSDVNRFEHWLDLNIEVTSGDVTFHWDVELADTDVFDDHGSLGLPSGPGYIGGDAPRGVWDNFWVKWQATDALAFKGGIYGVSDNLALVFDSAMYADGTMGLEYALDAFDLGAYLSKQTDGDEDDDTEMLFTAAGELGPAAMSLVYGQRTADAGLGGDEGSVIYFDADFGIGPVGVMFAYGSVSNDDDPGQDGGTIMVVDVGMEDLVGFDLTATIINTNEDWGGSHFGNDYGYAKILDFDDAADAMVVGLAAGYDVNDNLSIGALMVAMNDEGDAGDGPTEIDVEMGYGFADNVSYAAGYAMVSAGDTGSSFDEDATKLWHEIVIEF